MNKIDKSRYKQENLVKYAECIHHVVEITFTL